MNNIVERQNRYENIQKIAAFRQIYEEVKLWLKIQTIFSVPVVIILSIVALYINDNFQNRFTIILAVASVFITTMDLVFISPTIKKLKTKATLMQEYFDCDVLTIEWNKIKYCNKPNDEDILKYFSRYRKKNNIDKLANWYSSKVADLPLPIARIICQRTNCWWDIELRKKLNIWIIIFNLSVFSSLIILSCFNDLSVTVIITNMYVPLTPLIVFSYRAFSDNKNTIKSLSKNKIAIDNILEIIIDNNVNNEDLEKISRNIQDEISTSRENSFTILTSIYNLFKKNMEEGMNFSVSEFIKKYEEKNNYC